MARPLWFVNLLKKNFKYRFTVAEMTKVPILGWVLERLLFNGHPTADALFYLPKDRVIVNQGIPLQESQAVPSEIVSHFIEQTRYIFLMNKCICRDAAGCQEYDPNIGCIFLGEGVLDINPKLGRLVDKETALSHVARAREAGLIHLIGRDKVDALWMGVNPSDKLMTICNCCPCCCLFRFLPNLAQNLKKKVQRLPGVHIEVTEDCTGCGLCARDVCFINAIRVEDGRAFISDACVGCGRCTDACPQGAIRVVIEEENYIEDAIRRLSKVVDVK